MPPHASSTADSSPALQTLLLCDLVASTQVVDRIGDARAGELLARHDRIARDLLQRFDGREIDTRDARMTDTQFADGRRIQSSVRLSCCPYIAS